MRGKKWTWRQGALIVVDLQNYFLDKKSHAFMHRGGAVLQNTLKLIEKFRKYHGLVVYTRCAVQAKEKDPIKKWWGDSVKEGSSAAQLHEELCPKEKEPVFVKNTYSAFSNPELFVWLEKNKIKRLMIAGVATQLCCESTARAAFDLGFEVFMNVDCIGSWSKAAHRNSLKVLAQGFANLVSLDDL